MTIKTSRAVCCRLKASSLAAENTSKGFRYTSQDCRPLRAALRAPFSLTSRFTLRRAAIISSSLTASLTLRSQHLRCSCSICHSLSLSLLWCSLRSSCSICRSLSAWSLECLQGFSCSICQSLSGWSFLRLICGSAARHAEAGCCAAASHGWAH